MKYNKHVLYKQNMEKVKLREISDTSKIVTGIVETCYF